jgi:hypothetical protein
MAQQIIGKRGYMYGVKTTLVVWECPAQGCGIVYGIPQEFANSLQSQGGSYYCPNGHELSWDETDADRERKRAERAERRLRAEEDTSRRLTDNLRHQEHRARALKGHLTRMRNRIANGVCPVPGCKRSGFTNVMRHIAAKHPEWHHNHADELSADREEDA